MLVERLYIGVTHRSSETSWPNEQTQDTRKEKRLGDTEYFYYDGLVALEISRRA